MAKFKMGDKVRYIRVGGWLTAGKEYTVKEARGGYIRLVEESNCYLVENQFELVTNSSQQKQLAASIYSGANTFPQVSGMSAMPQPQQQIDAKGHTFRQYNGYIVQCTTCDLIYYDTELADNTHGVCKGMGNPEAMDKHTCICDLVTVLLPYGCKCNGA